jgi:transcriptional regulator with XRE-family HTH domain
MSELSFGDRIAFTRYKGGLSVHDLAVAVGVRDEDIISWESGKGEPSLSQAEKLISVIGYPLSYISKGEGGDVKEERSFIRYKNAVEIISRYYPDDVQSIISKISFDRHKASVLHSEILALENFDLYVELRQYVEYFDGDFVRSTHHFITLKDAQERKDPRFFELALKEDSTLTEADREYYQGGKIDVMIEELKNADAEELRKLLADALLEIKELKHRLGNLEDEMKGVHEYLSHVPYG